MQIFMTIIAFIIALGLLVTVHEYGHFWMARRMGVRVLRFSIGFGPPLLRWSDKQGTEFWLSSIPLGGYVKMLDRREGPVPDELIDQEFNQKTVGQRMAIFAAGPCVNLIFAALIYWMITLGGVTQIAPIVGHIAPHSILAQQKIEPGWELVAVDGESTLDWEAITFSLIKHLGESGEVTLAFKVPHHSQLEQRRLWLNADWMEAAPGKEEKDPLGALGLEPWQPTIIPVIGQILKGSVADKSGLHKGDRILSIARQPVNDWLACVAIIQRNPNRLIPLVLLRNNQTLNISLMPEAVPKKGGGFMGQLGVLPEPPVIPEDYVRQIKYSVWQAGVVGLKKTMELSWLTLITMGKMVIGQVSVAHISGPIAIAKIAGDRASYGLESFANFVAYLSISLGVLNLLPIPVLDGGHLLFAVVECIRRKPLSEKIQEWSIKVGASVIAMMMLLAFYNDIVKLL